jgi:hypothetical protein
MGTNRLEDRDTSRWNGVKLDRQGVDRPPDGFRFNTKRGKGEHVLRRDLIDSEERAEGISQIGSAKKARWRFWEPAHPTLKDKLELGPRLAR